MSEFVNLNLFRTQPVYFYKVSEFVTTFEADKGKNDPFTHEEIFKDNDLVKCRAKAETYYWKRLNGLEQGKYFLPFAAPTDFVPGENAAFSISLSLVEYYSEDEQIEHCLLGEDEETILESSEIEAMVLKEKGYS